MEKITVQNTSVMIISINKNDYISLTDIAKYKSDDPTAVIGNWMRNRNTIEYLGIWESLYNPNFKPLEFEGFKKEAGLNAFTLSPQKWINTTAAIGIISKSGRYGGTFAHKDIAFKFASWISVEFELYIVKEFQRLKEEDVCYPIIMNVTVIYTMNWGRIRRIPSGAAVITVCLSLMETL